ncbi:hypothetical protein PG996_015192 [Apiospora saccharicola]|uniref:Rhodopsin domain-containing protein n=1 Tax=Apiospora saccharicola TaxID=335842 RepID=A0ABR1TKE6_9PEZI
MANATVIYMGEPPKDEDRWAAWSREGLMQGIGALTMTLATIACVLRVYARTRLIQQKLLLDDSPDTAGADFPPHSGQVWRSGPTHVANDDGGIHHTVEDSHIRGQFTLGLAASYILSSEVAKISILMFYFRISPDKRFHIAVGGMIGILSTYSALYILLNIFGCTPVSDAWNVAKQAAGEAKCIDKGKFYLAAVAVNVAIDFIILLLPIPVIAPLQMPLRRKISLCLLFATGGFHIQQRPHDQALRQQRLQLGAIQGAVMDVCRASELCHLRLGADPDARLHPGHLPAAGDPELLVSGGLPRAPRRIGPVLQEGKQRPQDNRLHHVQAQAQAGQESPHEGAIELESDDDLSTHREQLRQADAGGTTDDQARLWSRVANHGRDQSSQNFEVTSAGHNIDALDPEDGRWKGSGLDRRNSTGINVTREVNVAYDSTEPLSHV